MKPFYQSKKFWTAIVTSAAMVVAYFHSEALAMLIGGVGSTLIVGFGLADNGKEAAALKAAAWAEPTEPPPPPKGPSVTTAAMLAAYLWAAALWTTALAVGGLAAVTVTGCAPTKMLVADQMAGGVNAATPRLLETYDEGGHRIAATAKTEPELERRLTAYQAEWAPVWTSLRVLRHAHNGWADALMAGRGEAALPSVQAAYCEVRVQLADRVELPALGCDQ